MDIRLTKHTKHGAIVTKVMKRMEEEKKRENRVE